MTDSLDFEATVQALEATGDYKVLRRLRPHAATVPAAGTPVRLGLVVDVETTGLDPERDEIIELGMTRFSYGLDGTVFTVDESFQGLRAPSRPILEQITAITGIDDAMVAGQSIDPADVTTFAAPAALVIAHNAAFDRRFLERFCEVFKTKPWACSMTQIDWSAEGYEGTKLAYLAYAAGFFYERHRALHDCLATIEILASPLRKGGGTALGRLLEAARQPTWRIWAENSPFDFKELLKARGYRWNGDTNLSPRAWYIDVADADREAELNFLRNEIFCADVDLLVRRVDAHDRFSDRC